MPATKAWWAQVTLAPEVNKIIVFNRGTFQASKVMIPFGGHTAPISILGDKLEWKNAQNIP